MSPNTRFIEAVEELKKLGKVQDYKSFAESIGVSKSFLSDIKSERKKVSVEVLYRMKNKYPDTDLEYIITGERAKAQPPHTISTPQIESDTTRLLMDRIQEMAEEIGRLKYQLQEARTSNDHRLKSAGDVTLEESARAV